MAHAKAEPPQLFHCPVLAVVPPNPGAAPRNLGTDVLLTGTCHFQSISPVLHEPGSPAHTLAAQG